MEQHCFQSPTRPCDAVHKPLYIIFSEEKTPTRFFKTQNKSYKWPYMLAEQSNSSIQCIFSPSGHALDGVWTPCPSWTKTEWFRRKKVYIQFPVAMPWT